MRGPRARWWTGVAVVALLMAGCAGGEPNADSSAAGTGWGRIENESLGGLGAQGMSSIAVGGPGLVAVGTESSGDDADGAVWISLDGLTWERVPPDEEALGGSGDQSMRSVTAGGPGFVAVGSQTRDLDSDAAVWVSADGLNWERVPHDEAVFGGSRRQAMNAVVAGGPGLVAVGYDEQDAGFDDTGAKATEAAVWVSADGLTWERVPYDEATFGGANSQVMNAVVAGGPGLVAVGYDNANPGWAGLDANAAVWTSPDGIAWTRVPDSAVFGDQRWQTMNAVTVGGPGLVAVGYDGPVDKYNAAVWTSVDGSIWARVPPDEAVFGGTGIQAMDAVTAWDGGLVAVGYDRAIGSFEAAVWVSSDGSTWARVPRNPAVFGGLGPQRMSGVAAGAAGLVAVGNRLAIAGWVPRDGDAAVWVSPPPSSHPAVP